MSNQRDISVLFFPALVQEGYHGNNVASTHQIYHSIDYCLFELNLSSIQNAFEILNSDLILTWGLLESDCPDR